MTFNPHAPRCERCRLNQKLCLCDEVPRVGCAVEVVLVPHVRDWRRPSNTGRLAQLVVGAEVVPVGEEDAVLDPATLLVEGARHLVLHPAGDPAPLAPRDDGRPVRLLVPDGSWKQSGRIARRLEAAPGVERVRVTPQAGPALRRRPQPDRACTAEAIAAALDALGETEPARALRAALALMAARTRTSKGAAPA